MKGFYGLLGILLLSALLWSCQNDLAEDPLLSELPVLDLTLKPGHMVLLRRKRQEALQTGLLVSQKDDYVPAKLRYKDQIFASSVRLKGDWLDHLKGKKWSLRVKMDSTQSLWGMQRFSLQHPRTRSYLDEWVFHQLLEEENLLCPQYRFVQVRINGSYKGIFALEEHFDRLLLERQGRREAPILKYIEDGFWQTQEYHQTHGSNLGGYLPIFEAAEIAAFQKGRTLGDSTLQTLYRQGRASLDAWRWSESGFIERVDTAAMARLLALADVAQAYHSLRWHNLRFYHNPFSAQLEPILYDAYGSNGPYRWFAKPFFGFYSERFAKVYFREEFLVFQLFNDPNFRRSYRQHLIRLTKPEYLQDFMARHRPEIASLEKAIQQEFSSYTYDWNFLSEQAEKLLKALDSYHLDHPPFAYTIFGLSYDSCRASYPFKSVSLQSEILRTSRTKKEVRLSNYYCQAIKIQATGPKKSKPLHLLDPPLELPAFNVYQHPQTSLELNIPAEDRYVFFSIPGNDFWYRHKINKWPLAPEHFLWGDQQIQLDSVLYQFQGDSIVLPAGKYTIDRLQVFPRGSTLRIAAGATIDLVDGGGFLIAGKLWMKGKKEQPISIYSSDGRSAGVQVLGATEALVEQVHFKQLNPLQQNGFWYSGGVNFYQSKLRMKDCSFEEFNSDDALNIVSCPAVELKGLRFSDCRGDALDVDFSSLSIEDCVFERIGGDALDGSGSQIEGQDLEMRAIVDKGISLGEACQATLQRLLVHQAGIGLAVKDASRAEVRQLSVRAADFGVAVFNKKNNFGAADLQLFQLECELCDRELALEKGQQMALDGIAQVATDSVGILPSLIY